MDIVDIPLHLIDEDTDQPRYQFGEQSLQELMNSIEELGLLSPIKVRTIDGGRYKIVYGNRRYKAYKALNRPNIPCIVSDVTDETEIYLEQIAENLTREGFSPIEEAEAFDKLLNNPKFSSSVKFLSGKLGKPESYIKNKCELLKFGGAVKKLVVAGTEIRKNQLTEEQLLPLKDLPMEYRDSLALIMAKDEMPVSDVKKIARLFKDKDISESTKGKLLFKTGPGLLETWSVYKLNKAERESAAEAKAAAKKAKAAAAEAGNAQTAAATAPAEAASPALEKPEVAASGTGEAPAAAMTEAPASAQQAATSPAEAAAAEMADRLNRLLAALSAARSSRQAGELAGRLLPVDAADLARQADKLLLELEKHAAEWRQVREIAAAKASVE